MDFSSVDDFLRQAQAAKQHSRDAIDDNLEPILEDPSMVGIPPDLVAPFEELFETFGDEALRQISLFCIGKWHALHNSILQQHIEQNNTNEGLATMSDLSRICTILQLIEQTGSFSGDEQWKKMLKSTISKAILKDMEERDISPELFFGGEQ